MNTPTKCPHCGWDALSTDRLDTHLRFFCDALARRRPLAELNPAISHARRRLVAQGTFSGHIEAEGLLRVADSIRRAGAA